MTMNVFIKRLIMSLFILLSSFTLNAQQMAKADAKISLEKLMVTHNYMKNPSENLYDLVWENNNSNPYKELAKPNEYIISCKDFSMPLKHTNKITSEFGYRAQFRRDHHGIDLKGYIGDTIYATFAGKVRVVKYEGAGYGYYVIIRHFNGLETIYAHMSKQIVKPNQYVYSGQPIGLVGNTGRSTGSHLHFETRLCGIPINPKTFFDFIHQDIVADTYHYKKEN